MVLFMFPKKFRYSNAFSKVENDRTAEFKEGMENSMGAKESTNGVLIGGNDKSSAIIGKATLLQIAEPVENAQLGSHLASQSTGNKDGNDKNSMENGASVENSLQPLYKINAERQQTVAGNSDNVMVPSSDKKYSSLALQKIVLQNKNGTNQTLQGESGSDKNATQNYASNDIKIALTYSSSENASKITQRQYLASDSTATGANSTKNATAENKSSASSNLDVTGDVNKNESAAKLPNADSPSDAAVSDAAIKNANGTKSTSNSSSNSANSVDDEEDADATTESTSSTSGKILAADDKDIEEVPDCDNWKL
jgi:hypothetical protein